MDGFTVLRRLRAAGTTARDHPDRAGPPSPTPWQGWRAAPTTTWPSRSASTSCWPVSGSGSAGRPRARGHRAALRRLALDLRTRRAAAADAPSTCPRGSSRWLEVFIRHAGQVLSREQLLSQVWGYDFDPGSNVVEVYVRYLRRKLGASGSRPSEGPVTGSWTPPAQTAPGIGR